MLRRAQYPKVSCAESKQARSHLTLYLWLGKQRAGLGPSFLDWGIPGHQGRERRWLASMRPFFSGEIEVPQWSAGFKAPKHTTQSKGLKGWTSLLVDLSQSCGPGMLMRPSVPPRVSVSQESQAPQHVLLREHPWEAFLELTPCTMRECFTPQHSHCGFSGHTPHGDPSQWVGLPGTA